MIFASLAIQFSFNTLKSKRQPKMFISFGQWKCIQISAQHSFVFFISLDENLFQLKTESVKFKLSAYYGLILSSCSYYSHTRMSSLNGQWLSNWLLWWKLFESSLNEWNRGFCPVKNAFDFRWQHRQNDKCVMSVNISFFLQKKRLLLVFCNDPNRNKADAANHVQVLRWLHFDSFVIKYNE